MGWKIHACPCSAQYSHRLVLLPWTFSHRESGWSSTGLDCSWWLMLGPHLQMEKEVIVSQLCQHRLQAQISGGEIWSNLCRPSYWLELQLVNRSKYRINVTSLHTTFTCIHTIIFRLSVWSGDEHRLRRQALVFTPVHYILGFHVKLCNLQWVNRWNTLNKDVHAGQKLFTDTEIPIHNTAQLAYQPV